MRYVMGGIAIFIVIILVNGIFLLCKEHPEPDEQTVILPKFFLVVGIVCSSMFLLLFLYSLFRLAMGKAAIWLVFSLLSVSVVIAYINCRISFDEAYFTAWDFWGAKHTYNYVDITAMQGKEGTVKLYIGNHVVRINGFAVGKRQFISFAKKQYRKAHDGTAIPVISPKKRKRA